jgi:GT2 family glycosyltransferase
VVRWVPIAPPSAVRQRVLAIAEAQGPLLLLLDDDVVLEPLCVQELVKAIQEADDVVAVAADISNMRWAGPTRAWRLFLRFGMRLREGEWQGRVLGPLLRFGYDPVPATTKPIEWFGAGHTIVRLAAYREVGGFSSFYLDRSSMNEDVDLALKLGRVGRILFCPAARMAHHQASEGRVSPANTAKDDLYNRFWILHQTVGHSRMKAFAWIAAFFLIETAANLASVLAGRPPNGEWARFRGRAAAVGRILGSMKRSKEITC